MTLGRIAALLEVPVIGTEQSPDKLGENVPPIRRLCAETVIKRRFDASEALAATAVAERRQVVLCGCEAHVCVLQTALGLQRLGFQVFVVEDAVGARRQACARGFSGAGAGPPNWNTGAAAAADIENAGALLERPLPPPLLGSGSGSGGC